MTLREFVTGKTNNKPRKGRNSNMNSRTAATFETSIPEGVDQQLYHAELDRARSAGVRDGWVDNLRTRALPRLVAALAMEGGQASPGRVPRPDIPARRFAIKAKDHGTVLVGEWVEVPPSEDEAVALRAYQEDQQYLGQLTEAADSLMEEIMSDMSRAWELHLHLEALDATETHEANKRREMLEREQTRERFECPVCQESDVLTIGEVAARPLLPGAYASPWWGEPLTISSCLACWHVASAAYVSELAHTDVAAGGTRAQVARVAINSKGLTLTR